MMRVVSMTINISRFAKPIRRAPESIFAQTTLLLCYPFAFRSLIPAVHLLPGRLRRKPGQPEFSLQDHHAADDGGHAR